MGTALVAGDSRGIGRAAALQLAQKSYTAAVSFHHNTRVATEVVSTIVAAEEKAFTLRADISSESQAVAMFESIDREDGPLTVLVSNAGVLFEQSTVESLTAERINRALTTNVTDCFLCCRGAVKHVSFRHGEQSGAIVSVSSAVSRLGAPFEYVDYAASKSVVDTLTTGLTLGVVA